MTPEIHTFGSPEHKSLVAKRGVAALIVIGGFILVKTMYRLYRNRQLAKALDQDFEWEDAKPKKSNKK